MVTVALSSGAIDLSDWNFTDPHVTEAIQDAFADDPPYFFLEASGVVSFSLPLGADAWWEFSLSDFVDEAIDRNVAGDGSISAVDKREIEKLLATLKDIVANVEEALAAPSDQYIYHWPSCQLVDRVMPDEGDGG